MHYFIEPPTNTITIRMAKKKKINRPRPLLSIPVNTKSKIVTGRPIGFIVCKAYNISGDRLLDFLKSKGYKNLNRNSLIDSEALKLVNSQFMRDKIAKDKIRGQTKIEFVNPNKFHREPVLYLHENIFEKIKQQIKFKNYLLQNSNFTDTEAINICSKMSSSFTRSLCRQLHNPKTNRQLILYRLHYIVNKALKLFGGKILTFIYHLRNLQFKNQAANEIKTYNRVIPDFPIISFDIGATSFKISFFLKQNELPRRRASGYRSKIFVFAPEGRGIEPLVIKKENRLKTDIRLFAPKTYEEIGAIDEEGYVLIKLEKFKPQLSLFYQATKNNTFKIYSGVETGNCEICGRELTHPTSLRIGLGPICARNKKIDSSLYHFS